jgi:hypothetical protein
MPSYILSERQPNSTTIVHVQLHEDSLSSTPFANCQNGGKTQLTITQLQDKNAISKYRFAIRQKGGQSHGD